MNSNSYYCFVFLCWAFLQFTTEGFQQSGVVLQPGLTKRWIQLPKLSMGASVENLATVKSQDSTLDWSFLDGVYLITCPNADINGQRLERAKAMLEKVGLLQKLEVKEFDTDDENRIRGCYTSHISVLTDVLNAARNEDKKTFFGDILGALIPNSSKYTSQTVDRDLKVLVLEDNIALSSDQLKQSLIDSVAEYTSANRDWDMIHLSYIPYVPDLTLSRTASKDIVKLSCGVGSALGTTAYIINTKAIKTLLKDDEENNGFYAPIPDVMAKLFPESRYATNPTIFVRAPNTKSLVNPQLDDLRSILFQPFVVVLAQQVLIVTGLTTNVLLPITVLLLLVLSTTSFVTTFDSLWMIWKTGDYNGPVVLPVLSGAFALFSLAILAKGAMLAPKQERK